jgi:hypothetical protein
LSGNFDGTATTKKQEAGRGAEEIFFAHDELKS